MRKLQLSVYYIQELNYRAAYVGFGTALLFFTTYTYKQSLIFLILPQGLSHFVSAGLTEIFFTYIQLCTYVSFNFTIIAIMIQIYLFLRPGLYTYESKIILNILIITIIFYACLYVFAFPLLIKLLWQLFSTYSQNFTPIHLTFEPRLNDYLEHVQELNKVLTFSLPFLILINIFQKYTNKKFWVEYRGIAYVLSFFIAASITPPDILSQTLVGLPLIFFYEIKVIFWSLYKTYEKKFLIRQPIKSYKYTLGNEKQRKRKR